MIPDRIYKLHNLNDPGDARTLYRLKFGEDPPFNTYFPPREVLEKFHEMTREAIVRERPLTRAECRSVWNFDDLDPLVVA